MNVERVVYLYMSSWCKQPLPEHRIKERSVPDLWGFKPKQSKREYIEYKNSVKSHLTRFIDGKFIHS